MRKKFWNSEKLLSIAAILISICTLCVFTYQVRLIRKHQYMSVYPHLQLANGGSQTLQYQYSLTNNGIGPALIESIHITAKDGKLYDDLADYVEEQVTAADSIYFYFTNLSAGRLIPAQEKIALIELIDNEELRAKGRFHNTLKGSVKLRKIINENGLKIKIRYKSIYGESWTLTNGENAPVKD